MILHDGTRGQPGAGDLTSSSGPVPPVRITLRDGGVLESDRPEYAETTEVPVAGAAPGTLFDYASIHIVTTSTLRRLEAAYPAGQFAIQRFRPNLEVDCPAEAGFVENAWAGRTLAIGPDLVLRVSIPCPRCVMTTLPQVDLPLDPGILRTAAQLNRLSLGDFGDLPCVGVYTDVVAPGRIRRNDPVRVSHDA